MSITESLRSINKIYDDGLDKANIHKLISAIEDLRFYAEAQHAEIYGIDYKLEIKTVAMATTKRRATAAKRSLGRGGRSPVTVHDPEHDVAAQPKGILSSISSTTPKRRGNASRQTSD